MKAAIIGYGKMGREIERILAERGHETALIIDLDNAHDLDAEHLKGIDVAIEFTTPATAYANIRTCLECGVAVVSGTTGWTDRLPELQALLILSIYSTNWSEKIYNFTYPNQKKRTPVLSGVLFLSYFSR